MVGPCSIIAASVCMCLCDEVRLYDLMHLLCMCISTQAGMIILVHPIGQFRDSIPICTTEV